MARPSYGAEAKRRSRHLLGLLLTYANDAMDCDESALDALRPQIQTRWQSDYRLVVRTKVRFLQSLTALIPGDVELNAAQIKESLKRFADFLEILEDNRPSRGGSETWHFTLNLWHKRQDITANLQQFDREWERRRPEKSQQVAARKEICIENTSSLLLDWQQICRADLEVNNIKRLTTNPLTIADGVSFELDQVYVSLGLVEQKQRSHYHHDVTPQEGSRLYEPEDTEVTQTFDHEEFLQQVIQAKQSKRIAIIGEPGAGKTTLLQKIATWVVENTTDLPIWISLADLQGKSLEQYLIQNWLPSATRKLRVSAEIEEEFCQQFNQGKVWLLLDAVDEMAIASTLALAKIASYLKGWITDATVILTCRRNVWDAGKNVLESFDTYCNLHFTYGDSHTPDRVSQFIRQWFRADSTIGEKLRFELEQPKRRRIRDAVKNPLRLALLCRIWGLGKGKFPTTKAMLYEQFVEAIYEWKQDRFPTTLGQRQQLNQALGQLALLAITQEKTKFRLKHSFLCQVLGNPDDGLFQLALKLGWLNQVGISENLTEKVYAFYHPTFQEYFAAQFVTNWRFFLNLQIESSEDFSLDIENNYRIFEPQWREVILLWLGRNDIPQADKAAFIAALINFEDQCGGFYSYQAYFLAAQGIAEFGDYHNADNIIQQLIKWRFGYFDTQKQKWWRYPPPIVEGARVALLKTDRVKAIAALEQFIQSCQNEFDSWNAAYSLGRTFDPGNKIAIATLENLVKTVRHESIRWQAAYSLGRIDPNNSIAIAALVQVIDSTKNEATRRKAAYSLGKFDRGSVFAISTLETIAALSKDKSQQKQAVENLMVLRRSELTPKKDSQHLPKYQAISSHYSAKTTALIKGITSCDDENIQRRRAYKLAQFDPGNDLALTTLLTLLKSSKSKSLSKRAGDNIKETILYKQLPKVIGALNEYFVDGSQEQNLQLYCDAYKLIWYCAENMSYQEFYQAWHRSY
ncbi:HEAT repeat domain-containing protein [Nostoc sp. UHCC 0870]|uniref:HEAT repeat domain-containing protein n=1 Tax=Nostoc sp. UHCC 0870 TaxID=2914041 RepID=UPI001EDD1C1F|nr:HEAT repeat domain-containing protein [Nostoc sp. UHCC 0870]UKO99801.1 HEAT repeat domain-containing protein [Nostoc sp. UHCC 0870]